MVEQSKSKRKGRTLGLEPNTVPGALCRTPTALGFPSPPFVALGVLRRTPAASEAKHCGWILYNLPTLRLEPASVHMLRRESNGGPLLRLEPYTAPGACLRAHATPGVLRRTPAANLAVHFA